MLVGWRVVRQLVAVGWVELWQFCRLSFSCSLGILLEFVISSSSKISSWSGRHQRAALSFSIFLAKTSESRHEIEYDSSWNRECLKAGRAKNFFLVLYLPKGGIERLSDWLEKCLSCKFSFGMQMIKSKTCCKHDSARNFGTQQWEFSHLVAELKGRKVELISEDLCDRLWAG